MKKRFKGKKRHTKFFKYVMYIAIIFLSYQVVTSYSISSNLANTNEKFLLSLINNSNYHMEYDKGNRNVIKYLSKVITKFDLNKPLSIFEKSFALSGVTKVDSNKVNSADDIPADELEKISKYIKDPNPIEVKNPKVYIYNSHQLENYNNKNLEIYNITPNVMMASYLLKDKLNKLGIPTIAEESNIIEFMRSNNWSHKDSYKASRFYVLDTINKHNDMDLIIDIHRDDLKKDLSTITIDNKKYAKVLFVVGMEHPGFQKNLDLANKINGIINKKYPSLSRGVLTKEGNNIDGIYNQDLSPNMILLELGGLHNTIDEVLNTVEAISLVIKEVVGAN